MRHFLDPKPLHVFAQTMGTLNARGLLRPGEGSAEIVAAIARLPATVTVDRSGLRARLHHAMHDAEDAIRLERARDELAVRAAVKVAVAGKKSSLVVKAAAEGARGSLSIAEARALAIDQAFRDLPQ